MPNAVTKKCWKTSMKHLSTNEMPVAKLISIKPIKFNFPALQNKNANSNSAMSKSETEKNEDTNYTMTELIMNAIKSKKLKNITATLHVHYTMVQ